MVWCELFLSDHTTHWRSETSLISFEPAAGLLFLGVKLEQFLQRQKGCFKEITPSKVALSSAIGCDPVSPSDCPQSLLQ